MGKITKKVSATVTPKSTTINTKVTTTTPSINTNFNEDEWQNQQINKLNKEVKEIKQDQDVMRLDISQLQSGFSELENDVLVISQTVGGFDDRIRHIEDDNEQINQRLSIISQENVEINERMDLINQSFSSINTRLDTVESSLDDYVPKRINILEEVQPTDDRSRMSIYVYNNGVPSEANLKDTLGTLLRLDSEVPDDMQSGEFLFLELNLKGIKNI